MEHVNHIPKDRHRESEVITYFENTNIDHVKADKSRVQTHICLCEGGASEVALMGEDLFHSIESSKHLSYSFVVSPLLCCKTSTVHSIVDIPIFWKNE